MSRTDILNRLSFICNKMIASDSQGYFLGKDADTTIANASGNTNYFINHLTSASMFNNQWLPSSITSLYSAEALQQVYIAKTLTGTWLNVSGVTSADLIATGPSSYQTKDVAINFTPILKDSGTSYTRGAGGIVFSPAPAPSPSPAPGPGPGPSPGTATGPGSLYKSGSFTLINGSGTTTQSFTSLLDLLNTIRMTYNLLEDTNFAKFKALASSAISSTSMNPAIAKYEITSISSGSAVYAQESNYNTIVATVNKLLGDVSKLNAASSNLDAIRRILLGYELMIHVYLSTYLLKTTGGFTSPNLPNSNVDQRIKFLINVTINKIIGLNDTVYSSSSSIGTLMSKLDSRITSYNNNRQNIENINNVVEDTKLGITIENNNRISNSKYFKSAQYTFYAFAALFVLLLIVLIVSHNQGTNNDAVPGSNGGVKLIVSLIAGVSIISMIVVYFINNNMIRERFGSLPDSSIADSIYSTGSVTNLIALYLDAAYGAFAEYLSNTIYIGLLIGTYRRYGDISHAINKETNYYNSLTVQLKQNQEKLQGIQTNDYRNAKVLQYRTYLLIQILIVVSLVVMINVYTPGSDAIHNMMIVFGTFFVLFFVYLYTVNANNLVHTDATKLYWGQPSSEMLN